MNYVTTNIRLSEDLYLALKDEAARKRISLSAVIRQKAAGKSDIDKTQNVSARIATLNATAKTLGRKLQGFNSVDAVRAMREEGM